VQEDFELPPTVFSDTLKAHIEVLKRTGINGCISGSCMLPNVDFSTWDTMPDIDLFCYTEAAYIHALCTAQALGYVPGGKGKNPLAEETKLAWTLADGVRKQSEVSAIQLSKDDVALNVILKKSANSVIEVLASYDMSIIQIGHDIRKDYTLDLRGDDINVATPNKLKDLDYNHPSRLAVWRMIAQWDRVIKYWNRGYDTRPMAEFYLDLINTVLDTGAIFGTDADNESFNKFVEDTKAIKDKIEKWIKSL